MTHNGLNYPHVNLEEGLNFLGMSGQLTPFVGTLSEVEKWLRKSEQGDKWNRCLIEGMIVLSETGVRDEQTTPP